MRDDGTRMTGPEFTVSAFGGYRCTKVSPNRGIRECESEKVRNCVGR